jgi:hypothetical protein
LPQQHGRSLTCSIVPPRLSLVIPADNESALLPRLLDTVAPILCFVDADMRLHPETFNAIEIALGAPSVAGGATGVTMERWSLGIALTFGAILPLVWLTGMDTGHTTRGTFRPGDAARSAAARRPFQAHPCHGELYHVSTEV